MKIQIIHKFKPYKVCFSTRIEHNLHCFRLLSIFNITPRASTANHYTHRIIELIYSILIMFLTHAGLVSAHPTDQTHQQQPALPCPFGLRSSRPVWEYRLLQLLLRRLSVRTNVRTKCNFKAHSCSNTKNALQNNR